MGPDSWEVGGCVAYAVYRRLAKLVGADSACGTDSVMPWTLDLRIRVRDNYRNYVNAFTMSS